MEDLQTDHEALEGGADADATQLLRAEKLRATAIKGGADADATQLLRAEKLRATAIKGGADADATQLLGAEKLRATAIKGGTDADATQLLKAEKLCAAAIKAMEAEDMVEAEAQASKAATCFETAGCASRRAVSMRILIKAKSMQDERRMPEAVQMANDEIQCAKMHNDKYWEAMMLLSLAEISYRQRQDHHERLKYSQEAARLFSNMGDTSMEAEASLLSGEISIQTYDLGGGPRLASVAVNAATRALEIFIQSASKLGQGQAFHVLAVANLSLSNFQAGMKAAHRAAGLFQELGSTRNLALLYHAIADLHVRAGPPQAWSARDWALKALELWKELQCKNGWTERALRLVVDGLLLEDDTYAAEQLTRVHLARAQKSKDKRAEAECASILVGIMAHQGNFDQAMQFAESSVQLSEQVDDKMMEAVKLQELASLHARMGQQSTALAAIENAQAIFRDLGNKTFLAQCIVDEENLHIQTLSGAKALASAADCQSMYDDTGIRSHEAMSLLQISAALLSKGQHQRATEHAWRAADVLAKDGNLAIMPEVYLALSQASLDPAEAAAFARKAQSLKRKLGDRHGDVTMGIHYIKAMVTECCLAREEHRHPKGITVHTAIKVAKQALQTAKKIRDRTATVKIHVLLAQLYGFDGKLDQALHQAHKGQAEGLEQEDLESDAFGMCICAHVYYLCRKDEKALKHAQEALVHAQTLNFREGEVFAAELLAMLRSVEEDMPRIKNKKEELELPAADKSHDPGAYPDDLRPHIVDLINQQLGTRPDVDARLLEAGLDSFSMVHFRYLLKQKFPVSVPASLLFDHPTIWELSDYILREVKAGNFRKV